MRYRNHLIVRYVILFLTLVTVYILADRYLFGGDTGIISVLVFCLFMTFVLRFDNTEEYYLKEEHLDDVLQQMSEMGFHEDMKNKGKIRLVRRQNFIRMDRAIVTIYPSYFTLEVPKNLKFPAFEEYRYA